MRKLFLAILSALALAAITLPLCGCLDPPPGEISVRTMRNGKRVGSVVMVFNEAGKQIHELPTDVVGLVFVKNLLPGTYTLKFKNTKGSMWPAEKTVRVVSDGSEIVDVELTEEPPPYTGPTPEEIEAERRRKSWNPFD